MKKATKLIFTIINLLLVILAVGVSINIFMHRKIMDKVIKVIDLLALAFGMIYLINKAQKKYKVWFFMYMWTFALSCFTNILSAAKIVPTQVIAATVIAFGMICLLTSTVDLGRRNSFILGFVVILCAVFRIINACVTRTNMADSGVLKLVSYSSYVFLVLAIIMNIMIAAKYHEKELRKGKGKDE